MKHEINETHDPNLRSWVESANDPNTDFPIQNLPLGLFIPADDEHREVPYIGVAIGDQIIDLGAVSKALWVRTAVEYIFGGEFDFEVAEGAISDSFFPLMIADSGTFTELRRRLCRLL